MNIKRVGIVFVVVSVLIALMNITLTGAVVGAGQAMGFWSIISLVSFVLGIFLLINSSGLETIVEEPEVDVSGVVSKEKIFKIFETNFPYAAPKAVVDSSFLISYFKDMKEMVDYLGDRTDVIVPEEVIDEFGGKRQGAIRDFLREETKRPDKGYKKHMAHAREVLNMGEKAYLYEIVEGILSGKDEMPLDGSEELKEYSLGIDKLKRNLVNNNVKVTDENLLAEAKKHWAVSDADAAVLAVAMHYESKGERSLIMEKDKDFEEAVRYIRTVDDVRGISYINAYGKVDSK